MLRIFAWVGLIVLLALPQRTVVKALRGARNAPARVSQQGDPSAPLQRGATEPIEVDDDRDDLDGDGDPINVSAVLAAQLSPAVPDCAVAMPTGTRDGVLWSLATQECGPPRA